VQPRKLDKLKGKAEDINDWHIKLNHAREHVLHETAKAMNHKISGTLRDCVACSKAKARNKNNAKSAKNPATKAGQ
jgi:hypothetical protein